MTSPASPASSASDLIVAFQGEHGAFSEKAAHDALGRDVATLPCRAFRDVCSAVAEGRADRGLLPVENSLAGPILPVLDALTGSGVHIVGETILHVVHHLIALRGVTLDAVTRVYTHPAAAAQCETLLRAHPEWTLYQVYDTAGAARMIHDDTIVDGAAIASAETAAALGMDVLLSGIESDPLNFTRFAIVACAAAAPKSANKASLVFGTRNVPGALLETLQVFARFGMNLTRLQSRPIPGRPWEYLFYVDVDGVPGPDVLEALGEHTTRLDVLGAYRGA